MARDLLGLMDALGVARAHLVGHAAGGFIGLAFALIAPERLGKLVVVNGWAKLDPYIARCFDVAARAAARQPAARPMCGRSRSSSTRRLDLGSFRPA